MSEFWIGFISGIGSTFAFGLVFAMVLAQAFFDAEDEEGIADETHEKNINELQNIVQTLTLDHAAVSDESEMTKVTWKPQEVENKEPIFVFAGDRSQFNLFLQVNGLQDSRYRFLEHVDQLRGQEWKNLRVLRVGNYYTRKDCAEIEAYLAAIGG